MAKKKNILQYYDIRKTIKNYCYDKMILMCRYLIVFGERSNGKSYSALSYIIEEFYNSNFTRSAGYIRRWKDDITSSNMQEVFKSVIQNDNGDNNIEKITKGEYNTVVYKQRKFYLAHTSADGEIDKMINEPMMYVFCLSESERKKSTGYPTIKTIIFEEFISEGLPMINEFIRFKSILSTIIRNRDDVLILMLGNTINRYNLYFDEFGLYRAKNQKQNTVDIYEYPDEDGKILKIACEFADFPDRKVKKSNIYFAFNREENAMIRNREWQTAVYPHLPNYYTPKDIKMIYFIKYDNEIFQCEIIRVIDNQESRILTTSDDVYSNKPILFTYIHQKTSKIKNPYDHIIFQQDYQPFDNYHRKINKPCDDITKFIYSFYVTDKVFYQNNTIGNAISSYINWCNSFR